MITSEIGEGEVEEALIRARLTTGVAVANVAGAVPPGGTGSAAGLLIHPSIVIHSLRPWRKSKRSLMRC